MIPGEQRLLLRDVLKEEKIECVRVADELFQSSRPGDFDATPTTYSRWLFHVPYWRDNATKLCTYQLHAPLPHLWDRVGDSRGFDF